MALSRNAQSMRSQSACESRAPFSSGGVMNSTDLPALAAMDFTASRKPARNFFETSTVGMIGLTISVS
jgi:hypothetical protein